MITYNNLYLFLLPLFIFVELNLIGKLYLSEIILILTSLLIFIFHNKRFAVDKNLKIFLLFGLIFFFSQIISDIYRQSIFEDYIRGLLNILLFILYVFFLNIILANNKQNYIYFSLGIPLGLFLDFFISPNIYASSGLYWKFGLGYPVTFFLALITLFIKDKFKFSIPFIFIFLSFLHFYLGFRSMGGICLLVPLYFFVDKLRLFKNENYRKNFISYNFLKLILIFLIVYLVFKIYAFLVLNISIFQNQLSIYLEQSGPLGVIVGGRQEIISSIYAIYKSPLIGYGSWAINPFPDNYLSNLLSYLGYHETPVYAYWKERLPTHSKLFGSWVTAGLFSILIWIWFLMLIFKVLTSLNKIPKNWKYFIIFISFYMIWNIFFSNFHGLARFYDAYFLNLFIFLKREINEKKIR